MVSKTAGIKKKEIERDEINFRYVFSCTWSIQKMVILAPVEMIINVPIIDDIFLFFFLISQSLNFSVYLTLSLNSTEPKID